MNLPELKKKLEGLTSPEPFSGCRLWLGTVSGAGYGRVYFERQIMMAHRASYVCHKGPIPEGMELDHLCRTPLCINPNHLEPVTSRENNRRRAALITHCPKGHTYTPENTRMVFDSRPGRSPNRRCKVCEREHYAKWIEQHGSPKPLQKAAKQLVDAWDAQRDPSLDPHDSEPGDNANEALNAFLKVARRFFYGQ